MNKRPLKQKNRAVRRGSSRAVPSSDAAAAGPLDAPGLLFAVLKFAVAGLLVARVLIPTEVSAATLSGTAIDAPSLWLVQLWLAAGALWAWDAIRRRDFRIRLGWPDAALAVVAAGHVVSMLFLIAGRDGDQRAAINMAWEWIGLWTAFFLIRQTVRTPLHVRKLLLVMTATAGSLAGLGLYQHHVWYPRVAEEYAATRGELDRLASAPVATDPREAARRTARIRALRSDLVASGAPLEGPGRSLWEDRLRSSTEPFGFFALANSFAGLLVAWLVVACGVTAESLRQRLNWKALAGPAATAVLIAYCLVLTKSRTAWVGLAAGLLVGAWLWFRSTRDAEMSGKRESRDPAAGPSSAGSRRPLARAVILAGVVVGGLVAAALATGGLDREVISEAPKSLRYRLQYWAGTLEVLRERPLLGTGPGNFRPHYLQHKRPASSEEIADPHNFVLDIWTSGGLVALIGLVALLVVGYRTFRGPSRIEPPAPADRGAGIAGGPLVLGAAAGFLLIYVGGGLFGGWDHRIPAVLGGAAVLFALSGRAYQAVRLSTGWLAAASVALLVHLLGAGGIEMPAVVQTLLILLAAGTVPGGSSGRASETSDFKSDAPDPTFESRSWTRATHPAVLVAGMATAVALFAGCLRTASWPALQRGSLVRLGDLALSDERSPRRAEALYRQAARHDPFSPEPVERLAALAFQQWQASPVSSDRDFERAVELQRLAIELDPHSAGGFLRLGAWYRSRFERTNDAEHARAAADALREAVRRYPNHSLIRAELADALEKAGRDEAAAAEAAAALELDAINRREGHRDKYLAADLRQRLRNLAGD